MIRFFLLSRDAFPANSSISAHRYSMTAARYTGAPLPTRLAYCPDRNSDAVRPTGKVNPAFFDFPDPPALPFLPPALAPFLSLPPFGVGVDDMRNCYNT